MPRAVIFDVDGTLIDTVDLHAQAWLETFVAFGVEASFDEVRSQIGKGGDNLLPMFLSPDQLARFADAMESHRSELFQTKYLPQARAFPGVRALFLRLIEDGACVAIGSSCKAEELRRYTDLAEVTDLVQVSATSDDAQHSKPCPDIFAAVLAKLPGQPDPQDVVVVGDSPFDAQAAAKLGLASVGVRCGGFPEAVLRQAGFAQIYDDPQQLLAQYGGSLLAGPRGGDQPGVGAVAAEPAQGVERADLKLGAAIASRRGTASMRALAKFGKLGDQEPLYALAAALTTGGLLFRRPRMAEAGLRVALAVGAADLAKSALKRIVTRTRPHVVMDGGRYEAKLGLSSDKEQQSFPSGHVAGSVGASLALGRVIPSARPYMLAACTFLGWTRIGKGAHWPSDVAAGAVIGVLAEAASATAISAVHGRLHPAQRSRGLNWRRR